MSRGAAAYVICLVVQVYGIYRREHGRRASIRKTMKCLREILTVWFIFSQIQRTK